MTWQKAITGALLGALCVSCATEPSQQDLDTFLERREICDHLRGEVPEPGDRAVMDEFNRQINTYCKGTDAQLQQMKRRLAGNPRAMEKLNDLEPGIESSR